MIILFRNEAEVLTNKEVKTLKEICKGCKKILKIEKLQADFWQEIGNRDKYNEIENFIAKIEAL